MDTLITKLQRLIVSALMVLLCLVVILSTADLGVLIAKEVWKPPRFLIPVQGSAAEDVGSMGMGPYSDSVMRSPQPFLLEDMSVSR